MDSNINNVLSSVMGNQDLMDKIKDIVKSNNGDTGASLEDVVSLIAPAINQTKNEDFVKNDSFVHKDKNNTNAIISSLSQSISKNSGLLIALKPYLSKERCQMIDSIVKISQIADALRLI